MENTWKNALSLLKSEVDSQIFEAWFLPLKEIVADDSSITLGVSSKFVETWLREKHITLIKKVLKQSSGKDLSVKFEVLESTDNTEHITAFPRSQKSPVDKKDLPPEKDVPGGWLGKVFGGTRQMPESRHQELGLNPKYSFDNFVVGPSNLFAHAASMAVCDKLSKANYNPLFFYGGVGLGKTHLMQAMGQEILKRHSRAKVLYITSEEFTNQLIHAIKQRSMQRFRAIYRNVDVLLIDDIQFIAGKNSTQEEFFNTFNALHDAHKQIVLCSDRSPQEIKTLEDRLVSRFAWGLVADIQLPNFETRMAIMEKKSENEAIKVPKEVLYFLAENIKTNIREMEGALIRVVAYSKLAGETISADLARKVLGGMINAEEKKITIPLIQREVAGFFAIKESDMKTRKRPRAIAYPRQLAMYLSRDMTDHSLPDIGGFFGGRDHTTVLHACDKIGKELEKSEKTRTLVNKLVSLIKK